MSVSCSCLHAPSRKLLCFTSAFLILSYFHNMTGLHKYLHKYTNTLIHTHRHTYEDARPTPKDMSHTQIHTHMHARQCLTNKYALTPTNMHIHTHTHTYNMRVFKITEGVCEFCIHRYQTYSQHHYLRESTVSSCPLPPHTAFSAPSLLYRWSAQTTTVMDGSGQQYLYNVCLPGRPWYARTFQVHAEKMSCNLHSGGDGRRSTRTDLKHVEDRQARARVPRGGERNRPHALG